MDQLLKFLLTQIVDQPDAVAVDSQIDAGGTVILTAAVAPQDMGRVIGKSGKIIAAIRDIVKVKAIRSGQRVKVVLAEPEQIDSLSQIPEPEPQPNKS